jgi:hypothetical protein
VLDESNRLAQNRPPEQPPLRRKNTPSLVNCGSIPRIRNSSSLTSSSLTTSWFDSTASAAGFGSFVVALRHHRPPNVELPVEATFLVNKLRAGLKQDEVKLSRLFTLILMLCFARVTLPNLRRRRTSPPAMFRSPTAVRNSSNGRAMICAPF